MSGQGARPMGEFLAANLQRLRTSQGWTQADLAEPMASRSGWTASTVSWVESGRRKVTAEELLWLCDALGVTVEDMLAGSGQVLRHDGRTSMALGMLRGRVLGQAPFGNRPPRQRRSPEDAAARDEDRKAAARLGIPPGDFRILMARVYRRPFTAERDRRIGDVAGLSPRSVQAKRGHATRQIIAELEEHLGRTP